MSDKHLGQYEVKDRVGILTLDDPPANTYTHEMMVQLDQAILRARFDEGVEVVVITGAGEKFFCAGANIQMLSEVTTGFKYCFCLHANETLNRLEHTPKLIIGALNGHTVGGGLEIAMACDLRVARKDGGKCGLPAVALGVLPGTGGTQRLVRIVVTSKAIQLMATGDTLRFDPPPQPAPGTNPIDPAAHPPHPGAPGADAAHAAAPTAAADSQAAALAALKQHHADHRRGQHQVDHQQNVTHLRRLSSSGARQKALDSQPTLSGLDRVCSP